MTKEVIYQPEIVLEIQLVVGHPFLLLAPQTFD